MVGVAQAAVLRRAAPGFPTAAWVRATVAGAVIAWTLGMLPSTVAGLSGAAESAVPPVAPPQALVLAVAAGMGAVLGLVLALLQWRVLRRRVDRAGWWLAGNAVAWACGMPIVFWAVDRTMAVGPGAGRLGFFGLALLATGAVVGAVHGLVLIALLPPGRETTPVVSGRPRRSSPSAPFRVSMAPIR